MIENEARESQKAISTFSKGLPIPGSNPGGECASTGSQAVNFGMTSMSTCTIRMNLEELKRFCRWLIQDPESYSSGRKLRRTRHV